MDKSELMQKAMQLVEKIDDLPTIPVIATQVLQLLDQPDVKLEEVADLILTDQVMTARVMKMINSPVYKPGSEITSLEAGASLSWYAAYKGNCFDDFVH